MTDAKTKRVVTFGGFNRAAVKEKTLEARSLQGFFNFRSGKRSNQPPE